MSNTIVKDGWSYVRTKAITELVAATYQSFSGRFLVAQGAMTEQEYSDACKQLGLKPKM